MTTGFLPTSNRLARVVFLGAVMLTALQLSCGYALEIYAAMRGVFSETLNMRVIRLDDEAGFHSVSSALVILIVAGFMIRTAFRESRNRRGLAFGWFCLGLIFIFMALDDFLFLHERLNKVTSIPQLGMFLHFRWVIVGLTVGAFLAAAFVPFLFRLHRVTMIRLVVAGAIFVGASMGLEMVGSAISEMTAKQSVAWVIEYVIEESLEDFSMLLALRAVLLHLYEVLPVLIAAKRQSVEAMDAANAS